MTDLSQLLPAGSHGAAWLQERVCLEGEFMTRSAAINQASVRYDWDELAAVYELPHRPA